jgi:LysM repeat protein
MNEDEDLERTLEESLDHHASRLHPSRGFLGDVRQRVVRQRARKRRIAVIGSIAFVGAGVGGLYVLQETGGETLSVSTPTDPPTTTAAPVARWACTGDAGTDPDNPAIQLFESCELLEDATAVPETTEPPPSTTTIPLKLHEVLEGDSVCGIADIYSVNVDDLVTLNEWDSPEQFIVVGDQVTIPGASAGGVETTVTSNCTALARLVPPAPGEQSYTVVAGDSVNRIARRHNVEPDALAEYNEWPEGVRHAIFVGDLVRIPPGADDLTTTTSLP